MVAKAVTGLPQTNRQLFTLKANFRIASSPIEYANTDQQIQTQDFIAVRVTALTSAPLYHWSTLPHIHVCAYSNRRTQAQSDKLIFKSQLSSRLKTGGFSASLSIYMLGIVATFFSQSTVHKGMIAFLPVWWRHFLCDLRSLHAFITTEPYIFPVSWWCSGSAATIWGSIQTYNTVSFVATYQHLPHLF